MLSISGFFPFINIYIRRFKMKFLKSIFVKNKQKATVAFCNNF